MKIAIVSMIREPWGGSEALWCAIANEALDDGHTVIHHSFDTGSISYHIKPLISKGLIILKRPGYINKNASSTVQKCQLVINFFKKRIKNPFVALFNYQPDVVVYNGTCYSIAEERQFLKCALKSKAKFVLFGHYNIEYKRSLSNTDAAIVAAFYKRCSKVFFSSLRSIQFAQMHLCTTISNARILRNPVNIAEIGVIPFPNFTNNIVQLAVVANLVVEHKGQDILLAALQQLNTPFSNWHLNIYGAGNDEYYLKQLVQYFNLFNQVTFHGSVTNIREVWRLNHVLLMPSHMEGMPLAVVEAMLCGRPCVVTNVGGHTEWIEHGYNGFIIEAASINAIKEALQLLFTNQGTLKVMGENAYKKAMQLYIKNPGKHFLKELLQDE